MPGYKLLRALGPVVITGLLAGCGGAGSSLGPQTGSLPSGVTSAQSTAVRALPSNLAPSIDDKCRSDHGVSVKPCAVTLTISNPVATVTTQGPSGTFTEKDNCTAKGIATVTGTGNNYTVTAGATKGRCKAVFTDSDTKGKEIGDAILKVNNKI